MIYDFTVKDLNGEEVSLSKYKGKVLLIVNTATQCGLTPQYEALESIYKKYKSKGLEILEFPCNQFFNQAPESDDEINNFCTTNYNTTFKRFAKIDVNGENASDLYKYLRSEAAEAHETEQSRGLYNLLSRKGFETSGDDIKWNFTKFLITKDGYVYDRYAPTCRPEELEDDIKKLLKQ